MLWIPLHWELKYCTHIQKYRAHARENYLNFSQLYSWYTLHEIESTDQQDVTTVNKVEPHIKNMSGFKLLPFVWILSNSILVPARHYCMSQNWHNFTTETIKLRWYLVVWIVGLHCLQRYALAVLQGSMSTGHFVGETSLTFLLHKGKQLVKKLLPIWFIR
jgi:hypothetical protein